MPEADMLKAVALGASYGGYMVRVAYRLNKHHLINVC